MSEDGEVVIITGTSDGRLLEMPIKGPREKKQTRLSSRGKSLSFSPLSVSIIMLVSITQLTCAFYGRMQSRSLI